MASEHEWLLLGTEIEAVVLFCKGYGIVGYPETLDEAIKLKDEHETNPHAHETKPNAQTP